MPSTAQNIDMLLLQANGWNRTGQKGLLNVLNEAQNILCQVQSEQFLVFDETTGDLPFLSTTNNQYKYNLPLTMWGVSRLVIAEPIFLNYNLSYIGLYQTDKNLSYPLEDVNIGGRKYLVYKQCRTYPKMGNTPASILLTVNPGTTTDILQYMGYKYPTQMATELIQPSIEDRFHYSHLQPAALKLIEGYQTGNIIESREYIEKELRPDLWNQQNSGAQGLTGHVGRRQI